MDVDTSHITYSSYALEDITWEWIMTFSAQSDIVPFTRKRLESYKNNPRALPSDHVLFTAIYQGKIISFRTVLPDRIYHDHGSHRIVWLSGAWTAAEWRRKGLSDKLLRMVKEKWPMGICNTNNSPGSHALLVNKGYVDILHKINGKRYFIHGGFAQLIVRQKPTLRAVYPILYFMEQLWLVRHLFRSAGSKKDFQFESISLDDPRLNSIASINESNVFKRGLPELIWIEKDPWVDTSGYTQDEVKRYPFTSQVEHMKRLYYLIIEQGNVVGFLSLFIKNNQLTIPYLFSSTENKQFEAALAHHIGNTMKSYNIRVFKTLNKQVLEAADRHLRFSMTRPYVQYFLADKKLAETHPELKEGSVQDGDGDHVFSN